MVDYVKLAATATRLVEANGRDLSFVQLLETPTDVAEPWRGNATPREASTIVLGSGVAVPPSSASTLGIHVADDHFLKRADQILICVAEEDIENFDEVIDEGSTVWKITGVEKLRPSTTTILYFVGVKR
tara:strand:- start:103 stop:489 length:387 start_codon:yes stop_codon:yes gene_type:complete